MFGISMSALIWLTAMWFLSNRQLSAFAGSLSMSNDAWHWRSTTASNANWNFFGSWFGFLGLKASMRNCMLVGLSGVAFEICALSPMISA